MSPHIRKGPDLTGNPTQRRRADPDAQGSEFKPQVTASVVVVTGASAGIGRAVAVAFGREGWRVALIARGRERLATAAQDVKAAGGQALVVAADVADANAIEAAAAQVVAHGDASMSGSTMPWRRSSVL